MLTLTPPWKPLTWYVGLFEHDKGTKAYFAAMYDADFDAWFDAHGHDLTADGWYLLAISDELPPL